MMRPFPSEQTPGRCILLGILLLILPARSPAQTDSLHPSGILALDLRASLDGVSDASSVMRPFVPQDPQRTGKSVLLATGLSALVPGAGQYYTEAPWWRTLLYSTVEVAGWTLFGVYTAKGNQATTDFENFADTHWDVVRYISWIADNYQQWSNADVDKQKAAEALAAIYRTDDPGIPSWARVDFNQLNKLERSISGGFSHTLPEHGDQQYYEQIGKYIQYRAGWDDHILSGDTTVFNPSRVTQRNRDYVASRERANALLGYAGTALWVVAMNHMVSAVDALLEARSYNVTLRSELKGDMLPDGRRIYAPGLAVTVRF